MNLMPQMLQIFDPAMCCSTGVCGPSVDTKLVQFAADLDGLLAARGRGELPYLREVAETLSRRTALVPWVRKEPAGIEGLQQLFAASNSTHQP